MKDAATLVIERTGLDVLHVEEGDWDDHDDMGPISGDLAVRLDDLARSLAAFRQDLGPALSRTTVLVYSEFGRRVDENGSGGQVLGRWPGLAADALDDGAVRVTTDFRDVFAELLQRRMLLRDLSSALPGHVPAPVGLFR